MHVSLITDKMNLAEQILLLVINHFKHFNSRDGSMDWMVEQLNYDSLRKQ